MNKKMLFIGSCYDMEFERKIQTTPDQTIQAAANEFQWKLINGFRVNKYEVDIISMPFVKYYTRKNKMFFLKGNNKNKEKINYIGFNNFFGYKNISRTIKLKKEVNRLLKKEYFDKISIIYIYSSHTPFLSIIKKIKSKYPNIKIVLNILDVPHLTIDKSKGIIYNLLKKIDIKTFENRLRNIDKYILITNQVSDFLNVKDYLVIEGMSYDLQNSESINYNHNNSNKYITYTGTLDQKYGIKTLLDSFLNLKMNDVFLNIAGQGDYEENIKTFAKMHQNIIFHGRLTHEQSLKLQISSTILVNPRLPEEFTKYSFPSKLIEYIQTGVPVISAKLEGIPKEYNEHLFYFDQNSENNLETVMRKVLNMKSDEYKKIEEKNKEFINKSKNNILVTDKIIRYMEGGNSNE